MFTVLFKLKKMIESDTMADTVLFKMKTKIESDINGKNNKRNKHLAYTDCFILYSSKINEKINKYK